MDSDQALIEKEFIASWDHIEEFYTKFFTRPGWEWLKPILNLITELRKRGYDKQLRAGQSLWTFCLSRSRKHGLRDDQSSICLELHRRGGKTLTYRLNRFVKPIEVHDEHIAVTPMMEKLLSMLLTQPID